MPFPCPDVSCPLNSVRLGYPWVELFDARSNVRIRNGFAPVSMTQLPPPGSVLRFNSTTNYSVGATDASNLTQRCSSFVTVPPLSACGFVEVDVTTGSQNQSVAFVNRTTVRGAVVKMKGSLKDRLQGVGSVSARLVKGVERYRGAITFQGKKTKGVLKPGMILKPFSSQDESKSLQIDLQVKNNVNTVVNVARFVLYCQEP